MKRVAYLLVMALLSLPAWGSRASAARKSAHEKSVAQSPASQHSTTVSKSAKQQKEEYQEKANEKLRQLDRQIDELKAKASRQGEKGREQFNKEWLPKLEQERDVALAKLEKFKNNSAAAWQDAKPELEAAINDLELAYRRAAAHFK